MFDNNSSDNNSNTGASLVDFDINEASAALKQLILGETSKVMSQHANALATKYAPYRKTLSELNDTIKANKSSLGKLNIKLRSDYDPAYSIFSLTKTETDDISMLKFISSLGLAIRHHTTRASLRLDEISYHLTILLKALGTSNLTVGILETAEASAEISFNLIAREFMETSNGFPKLLGTVYLSTKQEYKKLRKQFLGESSSKNQDKDQFEEMLFASFFGGSRTETPATGPAIALLDDNVVLTKYLMDISDSLPIQYEKCLPVIVKGKKTNEMKIVKNIDEGEAEDFARALIDISHPTFLTYINDPKILLNSIFANLSDFYYSYNNIDVLIRKLIGESNIQFSLDRKDLDTTSVSPEAIKKPFAKINFLAIRPHFEDIVPRTKMEKDFGEARVVLLEFLKETVNSLSLMNRDKDDESMEKFSKERVLKAIELKTAMDDVQKTEFQKNLSKNIRDDNEFYTSKSGNLGSIEVERAPAPKINYENVIGASFNRAKEHVVEVIKIASLPHIMRLSAPRGDIRSNLLLIGPYGCGKTELARAIGADPNIIGLSATTADLLTAYMHESVKNVKKLYEHAAQLRKQSRYSKPVCILLDEIDRFFNYGEGAHQAYDGPRMEGILQEVMDGVVGYEGVFLVGLTNVPKGIPPAILRRFKFVDVVGQLTREERADLFKMFLGKALPLDPSITQENYLAWAELLADAPGDVIGKVADEIHFKFMKEFVDKKDSIAASIEKTLTKRLKDRDANDKDKKFIRTSLAKSGQIITVQEVSNALTETLAQPQVQMQILTARQVYKDAENILKGLSVVEKGGLGFGAKKVGKASDLWGTV